ncbi:MAG: EAL domain-containing protein [Deltaproteobacteria bacterium]|nr:EAL domain-containing protein [Deltaproteobacteria bacterium]
MIIIDASKINKIEHEYGKDIYGDVLKSLLEIMTGMAGNQIRTDDILTVNHTEGEQFYVFLSKKRTEEPYQSRHIETVAERVGEHINEEMFKTVFPLLKKAPRISVGYAITIHNPLIREERLINKLIEDAKVMADYLEFRALMRSKEKLQEIITKEEIYTIYQPIVDLVIPKTVGYEALSRGPINSGYENPYVLFTIAEETDLLFELDRVCRRRSLINAQGIPDDQKLFVNILPSAVHDPEFKGKSLTSFLDDIKISPTSIVLEISERHAIDNFPLFKEASDYYSDIGFALAIDDTGAGHSNLKSLVEININYVKLDISLIRNVDKDPLRQEIVKAMIQIGNSIGAHVIAEGIETPAELKALLNLGLIYGQGFLFGKPAPPFSGAKFIEG